MKKRNKEGKTNARKQTVDSLAPSEHETGEIEIHDVAQDPLKEKHGPINGNEEPRLPTDKVYRCGWWCIHPNWIQFFANPKWAVLFLSVGCLLQGMTVNGLLRYFIAMLEKRFGLSSFQTGFVSACFDIASVCCLIPITYLGGAKNSHRPTYIGGGLLVLATGSMIFASPGLITGPYRTKTESKLCTDSPKVTSDKPPANVFMFLLLALGNFVNGAGASPLFTLVITYIDDSVHVEKSSIYLGFYYTMVILGPALGYSFGGIYGNIHVDFHRKSSQIDHGITPDDEESWVGAWWLGFVINSVLFTIVSIPIFALPKSFYRPEPVPVPTEPKEEPPVKVEIKQKTHAVKKFFYTLISTFKNGRFILITLSGCCDGMVISGVGAFLAKIFQLQLNLSWSEVSTIVALVAIPGCLIGLLIGGYVIRRFTLSVQGTLKLCILLSAMACVLHLGFLFYCEETLSGVRLQRGLVEPCNFNCHCDDSVYMPVCDYHDRSYFSACFAGCTVETKSKYMKTKEKFLTHYTNCSCILHNSTRTWDVRTCQNKCLLLNVIGFLSMLFMYQMTTFTTYIPALKTTLRMVNEEVKSLSLGVQWIFVRVLSTIPAPIIYGTLIDRACRHWHNDNEKAGECLVYDHFLLSRYLTAMGCTFKLLQCILFFATYKLGELLDKKEANRRSTSKLTIL